MPLVVADEVRSVGESEAIHRDQSAAYSQPMTNAVMNEATNRDTAIIGWPGNADQRGTTTGLMAGAASRNASAAGGATPAPLVHPPQDRCALTTGGGRHPWRKRQELLALRS